MGLVTLFLEAGTGAHFSFGFRSGSELESNSVLNFNYLNLLADATNNLFLRSVVDPNTLTLDPDPGFWPNLDPDPGLYNQF